LAAHLGGLVVLRAVIGKDGRVLSVGVISGPAMLQQAAIDAVEQWVYKPYLLNNVPTEVNTTIKILFPLNFNIAPNRIPESGHPHAVF
jgi:protein TonB